MKKTHQHRGINRLLSFINFMICIPRIIDDLSNTLLVLMKVIYLI